MISSTLGKPNSESSTTPKIEKRTKKETNFLNKLFKFNWRSTTILFKLHQLIDSRHTKEEEG
jgi:hypothetical protein